MPNYFDNPEVAARYERARPFYHGDVAARILSLSGVARFRRALDVGCGTGKSTVALASIAEQVVAIDPSREMLEHAPARANIEYRVGTAERLEFDDGEFDLVTVASALHWFDQPKFFAECRRVLAPDGWLAIYNDHFTAHVQGNPGFKQWVRRRYLKRYRQPARRMTDFSEETATEGGFRVVHAQGFDHLVCFTREEFTSYLLTHTNTLAVIERGEETTEEVSAWLNAELAPMIDGPAREFIFKCNLWMLR